MKWVVFEIERGDFESESGVLEIRRGGFNLEWEILKI